MEELNNSNNHNATSSNESFTNNQSTESFSNTTESNSGILLNLEHSNGWLLDLDWEIGNQLVNQLKNFTKFFLMNNRSSFNLKDFNQKDLIENNNNLIHLLLKLSLKSNNSDLNSDKLIINLDNKFRFKIIDQLLLNHYFIDDTNLIHRDKENKKYLIDKNKNIVTKLTNILFEPDEKVDNFVSKKRKLDSDKNDKDQTEIDKLKYNNHQLIIKLDKERSINENLKKQYDLEQNESRKQLDKERSINVNLKRELDLKLDELKKQRSISVNLLEQLEKERSLDVNLKRKLDLKIDELEKQSKQTNENLKKQHNLELNRSKNEFEKQIHTIKMSNLFEINKLKDQLKRQSINKFASFDVVLKDVYNFFNSFNEFVSESFIILNLSCKIRVHSKLDAEDNQRYFEFYLQIDKQDNNEDFRILDYDLRLRNQHGKPDKIRNYKYQVTKSICLGCKRFLTVNDLLDPINGFVKDNCIHLGVDLKII